MLEVDPIKLRIINDIANNFFIACRKQDFKDAERSIDSFVNNILLEEKYDEQRKQMVGYFINQIDAEKEKDKTLSTFLSVTPQFVLEKLAGKKIAQCFSAISQSKKASHEERVDKLLKVLQPPSTEPDAKKSFNPFKK